MTTVTVRVKSPVGLHARPAAQIVQAAKSAGAPVQLSTSNAQSVDATSLMTVMSLDAKCGTEITVSSEDSEAVAKIAQLISKK